jgi:hypothetical protein
MAEWAISQVSGADTALRDRLARSGLVPATGDLTSRSGVFAGGAVTLGSGMSVSVAPFRAHVQGAASATQGGYLAVLDTAKSLTFADGGASSRTDLIVGRVYENVLDASGFTKFAVEIFQGTPGAGTPATPSGAVKLAEKVITAGMTAGTGGLGTAPTDKRGPRLVAAGGVIPVTDAADRDTLIAYDGLIVHRLDLKLNQQRVDGAWQNLGGDTGWINLTVAAPFTASAGATPRVRVRNGVLHLDGAFQRNSGFSGSYTTAATLPDAAMFPTQERYVNSNVSAQMALKLTTGGVIQALQSAASAVPFPIQGLGGYPL